jgi:hypothetical protein
LYGCWTDGVGAVGVVGRADWFVWRSHALRSGSDKKSTMADERMTMTFRLDALKTTK